MNGCSPEQRQMALLVYKRFLSYSCCAEEESMLGNSVGIDINQWEHSIRHSIKTNGKRRGVLPFVYLSCISLERQKACFSSIYHQNKYVAKAGIINSLTFLFLWLKIFYVGLLRLLQLQAGWYFLTYTKNCGRIKMQNCLLIIKKKKVQIQSSFIQSQLALIV